MAYKKIEKFDDDTTSGLITSYKQILKLLGQDTEREGLAKTPERLAKAMQYLTHGYDLDAHEILSTAKFREEISEMIVVKDIELYSGGCVRTKAAGAGAAHHRNSQCAERYFAAARRGSGHRSVASLHDDEGSAETEFGYHHFRILGRV